MRFAQTCMLLSLCLLTLFSSVALAQDKKASTSEQTESPEKKTIAQHMQSNQMFEGYFSFYWDDQKGEIWLANPRLDEEFLYVNYLSTGLGSNPVGLDRGKLDRNRVVRFVRIGPQALLLESNLKYRANSDDPLERRAVEESFAQSVLWSGKIVSCVDGILLNITDLLLRDANQTTKTLKDAGAGSYQLDRSRSAVFLDRTKSFPKNTEFESLLTFESSTPGSEVRKTTPSPEALTLRQHHSFVQLPDANYRPRRWHPRAGYFSLQYYDYAVPIDQPTLQRFITRHRLEIDDQGKVVEPIVYYVDSGTPEPIRSALLEGARWWSQAFEYAGLPGGFQVEILPPEKDPLDIRNNVIQWVHRATRGWSYGASVIDPRTGEILKGHVTLGSLRVRQDHLLFEGLDHQNEAATRSCRCCQLGGMSPNHQFFGGLDPQVGSTQLALARLRQLSAHEVGHTLGLAHNFASSTQDRASVMDYPAPWISISPSGELDLRNAYGVGVGAWDREAIRYGYQPLEEPAESAGLAAIVRQTTEKGLLFISDADARPMGAFHPLASLWDTGSDPVVALRHTMRVRRIALDQFGKQNLDAGRLRADLENIYVPLFLHHRYQVEATAKVLGGAKYQYGVRGEGLGDVQPVPPPQQTAALTELLSTLDAAELQTPSTLARQMMPRPFWDAAENWEPSVKQMPRRTGLMFDPHIPTEIAAQLTLSHLLHHERALRLQIQHRENAKQPDLCAVIDRILEITWQRKQYEEPSLEATARVVDGVALNRLIKLAQEQDAAIEVRAIASQKLFDLLKDLKKQLKSKKDAAHYRFAMQRIEAMEESGSPSRAVPTPPGSPIGVR